MPPGVLAALIVGLALIVVYLVVRGIKYRSINFPVTDFFEAIGLVFPPLPVPILIGIFGTAVRRKKLPVFDALEDRIAIVIGASVLIIACVLATIFGLLRAFRPVPGARKNPAKGDPAPPPEQPTPEGGG